jgi:type I restriction enzyme M protein
MTHFKDKANLIWSVADLLRGDYRQSGYDKVILPMTVLHRLDSLSALETSSLELEKTALED